MNTQTQYDAPKHDDTLRENVEDLVSHIGAYIDTQKQLFQIHAAEKISAAVSTGVSSAITVVLALLVLLFFNVSAALYLGHLLGSYALGFLVTGSIYLALLLIFMMVKKSMIQEPITQSVISKIMDLDNEK